MPPIVKGSEGEGVKDKKRLIGAIFGILSVLFLITLSLVTAREEPLVTRIIIIPKGASAKKIAQDLEDEGLIKSRFAFLVLARITGAGNKLKAGEYELNNRMGMIKIIKRLEEGKGILHHITIPPGYTLKDIANLLEREHLVDRHKFLKLCHDPSFINRSLSIVPPSLEGYLFPDTYFLHRGMDEERVISLMVNRFNEMVKRESIKDEMLHRTITLASIVEREAKIKEEYHIISAVFHNRLKRNMALQSCATVLYALGERKPHLSIEDTRIPSPYNTYIYPGLPPGPICNPSTLAIKAVLNPADVDYLYFVLREDGSHIFSKTGSSHTFYKSTLVGRKKHSID